SRRRARDGTTSESTATGDSGTSADGGSFGYRSTQRGGGGRGGGGRRQEGRGGVDRDRGRRDRDSGRSSRERRHDGGRRDDDDDEEEDRRSRDRRREDRDRDRYADSDRDRGGDRERPSSDRQGRRGSVEEERGGGSRSTVPRADDDRSRRDDSDRARRGRETGGGSTAAAALLRKGERVETRYRGKGTKFYKGKVARVNSDDTLDIDYDDGEKELGIAEEHVRSLESPSDSDGRGGDRGRGGRDKLLSRGDVVEARYRGKGTKFYKGKISRVNDDGTFDIAYDDGEREIRIDEEHVRLLESSGSGGGSGGGRGGGSSGGGDRNAERGSRSEGRGGKRSLPREGDKVEVNYRGRGKFYKGRIARVNLDGTFNIDYDDGEKERGVSEENVRSVVGEATTNADSRTGGRGNRDIGALQRGDRVEARYRGRGTKFYKGKIKRVNSDNTFDIDYDDGEKDLGIAAENVVALRQPTTASRGNNDRDGRRGRDERSALQQGDKVEGNYRGRGRFYKGIISRVNLDGTFNIDYNDGEKERGLADDMIRKEKGGAGEEKASAKLKRGDRVEARYRGKGNKFYKGKIARVNSDATFDVNYDDGEKEIGIAEEHVVSLEPAAARSERTTGRVAAMAKGDRVEARYRGRGTKFYKGEIARVNSDGTFDINYDDGEKELGIAEEHVTSLEPAAASGGRGGGDGARDKRDRGNNKLAKGDRVEARYRGRGTKFYKGKISRVNSDDTFDIAYDDGEKELGIGEEHVRSLETDGRDRSTSSRAPTLSQGDKVEADFRGRGRFYTGRISRVNLDGTFNIDYDDGEKERGITDDLIRPLDRGSAANKDGRRGGGGGRLQRGDKVEARYRGRGTKFYKGKIVRVNSDATFDIDYDDGEKERGIAEEHVRALDGGDRSGAGRGGREQDAAGLVEEGDKVEANYRGRGRYYKGRVRRVNRDGTFDIDYDDGEKERGVPTDMVRTSNELGKADRGGARSAGSSQRLLKGDTVEARYRGRGIKFYKGIIVRVNSDDTFDIDYDDGEKERGIAEEHVRSLGSKSSAHEREGTSNNATIMDGDKVEANYRGRGRYYKGVVNRVHRDGTVDIDYDDGEKEKGVRQGMVRALEAFTRTAPGKGGGGGGGDSSPLKRGDRVEARYRGRGTKFYKGKVVRVNSDATLDIDYDDGEKEIGIGGEHVRSLESEVKETNNSRSRSDASGPMLEGDKVEANYRGRGRFYKGRISRVNLDGTFNIDYDDGEKERGITDDLIRVLESGGGGGGGGGGGRSASPSSRLKAIAGRVTARSTTDSDVGKLKKGDAVEARYRGRGTKFYKGRIVRVNSDDTFDIDYDDGEQERSLRGEHVRPLEPSAAAADRATDRRSTTRQSKMQRGDKVEARYRGRGTKFFPGRISRVNSDGTFDIDYDDGDKDVGIGEEHVRSLGRPRSGGGDGGGDGSDDGLRDRNEKNLREGGKVEANYRGRGRYYKGRIRRVNSNGTFDIDYDDGEKERDVDKGSIR
ncbi:unnamed protein product, partial [Laminaria digitata]